MNIPEEIIGKARRISEEVENFNSLTWREPYRDQIGEVAELVWREAFEAGHAKGYAEGVHEGGCDFCRF